MKFAVKYLMHPTFLQELFQRELGEMPPPVNEGPSEVFNYIWADYLFLQGCVSLMG